MLHTPATAARHPLSMCFLCVENAARSQMAEAFARTMLDPEVEIYSAGSMPGRVDPHAIAVMAEIGIDISRARPKGFAQVPLERVATLVVMCPWEAAPTLSVPSRILHWGIANPHTHGEAYDDAVSGDAAEGKAARRRTVSNADVLARYRRTRDRIASRLRALLAELELRASMEAELLDGTRHGDDDGGSGLRLASSNVPGASVGVGGVGGMGGMGSTPGAGFGV